MAKPQIIAVLSVFCPTGGRNVAQLVLRDDDSLVMHGDESLGRRALARICKAPVYRLFEGNRLVEVASPA